MRAICCQGASLRSVPYHQPSSSNASELVSLFIYQPYLSLCHILGDHTLVVLGAAGKRLLCQSPNPALTDDPPACHASRALAQAPRRRDHCRHGVPDLGEESSSSSVCQLAVIDCLCLLLWTAPCSGIEQGYYSFLASARSVLLLLSRHARTMVRLRLPDETP